MAHQTAGMTAYVTTLSPEPEAHHNKPEEHPDTLPSEYQPVGVDDEPEYESLEQALLGE